MVTRSILRPVLRPMPLPLTFDDGPFFPRSLFSAGEQGIWLDPSDFSTLFQDAAGTTPVTAVGQPVGKILDKSGRGNHASQTTSASRPTLQQDSNGLYYLSFDGTDDGMATPSIDFTGTDKMTVWAGVRKLSDAARGLLVELSASFTGVPGSFDIEAPSATLGDRYYFGLNSSAVAVVASTGFAAPLTSVLSCAYDIAGATVADEVKPRVNGVAIAGSAGAAGTGNFSNSALYIGRRGGASLPFNGRIYQLIVRGAASNDGQIAATEAWVNGKTRAY